MEVMVENNERLLDVMNGGQLYGYKERTQTEVSQIATGKRVKGITGKVEKTGAGETV